ncbi:peptidylprolyl isomerase [Altererythrobacter litoralis]|uniref:Peptidylprolyl isomerase n=1 Tax=Altererythrobacter litoralis TaxID=3113904 RepID=A0ABU7GDQ3_9SPHN|nr:peptidylprolyl isomerase [Erythrobacteraceae bacterium 1XM1-14]
MITLIVCAASALAFSATALARESAPTVPSPNEIVAAAPQSDWVRIPADELLVMDLAPDAEGNPRRVVIQLMPPPFSKGWVHNIKLLARSGWFDNISINRVQDNYVVQWGDPNYDNPEAEGETKKLPEGMKVMGEDEYVVRNLIPLSNAISAAFARNKAANANDGPKEISVYLGDAYQVTPFHFEGWPITLGFSNSIADEAAPVHCYGMVGVGRNLSPDTGSGAELYTVIGHAPRHLDRNIALVGRVVEGMEHLSSLPRGKGELGFYADFEKDKRTPILTVRMVSDLPASSSEAVGQQGLPQPAFEYLSTESESFARYAEARANRRDAFFIHPAGGADICNIPVPVRRVPSE